MSTRAKPQKSTHTHTHTHTHTDSFLKSLKQIGTICFTFSFLIFPNFASADNIPTTNPGCTTTVLGAQNIANGSAALEPDFSANTINTTWYSNGTQLTGNNIPATCTYDDTLTPPTPAARPGYVFAGWEVQRSCELSDVDTSVNGTGYVSYGRYSVGTMNGEYQTNDPAYPNWEGYHWAVSFPSNRDIFGRAFCAEAHNSGIAVGEYGTPTGSQSHYMAGDAYQSGYCWCRVTKSAIGSRQCDVESDWLFLGNISGCLLYCQDTCAQRVYNEAAFRESLYGAAQ